MQSTLIIPGRNNTISGLFVGTNFDAKLVQEKTNFPILGSGVRSLSSEIPISIRPQANFIILHNVDLIQTDAFRVLYRTIPFSAIVQKTVGETELIAWLKKETQASLQFSALTGSVIGLNTALNSPVENFAKQLLSLSIQDVREAIIDNFIREHSKYFAESLGYNRALSQIQLAWIERRGDDPSVSKPDYLMERRDGFFDILDLKTGATHYRSLTKRKKVGKGGKARIRFSDYVSELIAQLCDYRRYFSLETNANWAYDKYGVKVKEPKLIGIVGNYNNFDRMEVDSALMQYKDSITIISYTELVNLLRLRRSIEKREVLIG